MEDAKKMKESNWDYSLVRDIFEKYYEIDYCQYRIDYSIEYTDVFKDYFDYILKEL